MTQPAPKPPPRHPWQEPARQVCCRACGLCALIRPSMRAWPYCCGEQMTAKETTR